jgi:hypothetical protein
MSRRHAAKVASARIVPATSVFEEGLLPKYDQAALVKALQLQESAEETYANCEDCEGYGAPEQCEKCFPLFDKARIARRAALSRS